MDLTFRDLAKPGPSLSEVLQGLSREIVENIERLPEDSVTRIHDIRVGTKKIQGLLRLSGKFITSVDQLAVRALTRSIRTAFAGQRDEEVIQLRLKELLPSADAVNLAPAPVVEAVTPEEALGQARQLATMLAGFPLEALHRRDLVRTAAASYRKARRLSKSCHRAPEDESMHTWRKRVKDVSYQTLALASLPKMARRTAPLDRLADALGEYHDLAVLQSRLESHANDARVVARRKQKVGKTAFKLAAKIFAKPPGDFARTLGRSLRKHSS